MIEELIVKGFRILRDFTWTPASNLNILVGANSAGKSTVLDAIELVTRGSLHGQSARFALSPDWFNEDDVERFYSSLAEGDTSIAAAPEILIAATFRQEAKLANMRGAHGPKGAKADATGLILTYKVRQELYSPFIAEAKAQVESGDVRPVIPVEYYECCWKSFKGDSLVRKPRGIVCSRVDADPEPHSRAVDTYARNYVNGELEDDKLREVTSAFRRISLKVDHDVLSTISIPTDTRDPLGLQIDKSPRSDWRNSIVLHRNGLPLSVLGSAEQVLTKCAVALAGSDETSILLLEEPECHLSHTSLNELVSMAESAVREERQAFITTHSPFVLNRLGLNRMFIMAGGMSPDGIGNLTSDTVKYFKRLSGYDTLRVALAERIVLVEGPTDEMVFDWAFRKMRGRLPQDCGIDVMECGTQHRRFLELAAAVGKERVVALRDNDGEPESHWLELAKAHLSDGRRYICGHDGEGYTIEPQMVFVNKGREELLARVIGCDIEDLEQYMTDHKTGWALSLIEESPVETASLEVPRYIREAIDFIDPCEDRFDE